MLIIPWNEVESMEVIELWCKYLKTNCNNGLLIVELDIL
jgi:hypothetical protein